MNTGLNSNIYNRISPPAAGLNSPEVKKRIILPNAVGKIAKVAGTYINTPEHKLVLATTALMFQPMIDLVFAREDKKKDSAIKSASKAIAGGITGVSIRAFFNNLIRDNIKFNKQNVLTKYFLPGKALELLEKDPELARNRLLNQYGPTMGTFAALVVMIGFTNSHVDVPLTSDIQDFLGGIIKEDKPILKSFVDVVNSRKEKMLNGINKFRNKMRTIHKKTIKILDIIKSPLPDNKKNEV